LAYGSLSFFLDSTREDGKFGSYSALEGRKKKGCS
jgi:hypothetical protein